jgi:hypothetical protein
MTHRRKHETSTPGERIIVHSMDDVPTFATEFEEVAYWDTHELAADLFRRDSLDPDEEAALARIRERRAASRRAG